MKNDSDSSNGFVIGALIVMLLGFFFSADSISEGFFRIAVVIAIAAGLFYLIM